MKGLFVLTPETADSLVELREFSGNELVLLVVPSSKDLTNSFDEGMASLSARAKEIEEVLSAHSVVCKTLVEWGEISAIVPKALEREDATLINTTLALPVQKTVDEIIQERLEQGAKKKIAAIAPKKESRAAMQLPATIPQPAPEETKILDSKTEPILAPEVISNIEVTQIQPASQSLQSPSAVQQVAQVEIKQSKKHAARGARGAPVEEGIRDELKDILQKLHE